MDGIRKGAKRERKRIMPCTALMVLAGIRKRKGNEDERAEKKNRIKKKEKKGKKKQVRYSQVHAIHASVRFWSCWGYWGYWGISRLYCIVILLIFPVQCSVFISKGIPCSLWVLVAGRQR